MKTCATYAKVSTPEESVETQLHQLRELAAERGYEVVQEYSDRGASNAKARRPGLDAMMADAKNHKFGLVMVASLCTIFRSTRHLFQTVDELQKLGVEFLSIKEGIDTSGQMGKAFSTVLSGVTTLESDLRRDKIRLGMRRRKLDGFPLGRQRLDVDHEALVRDRLSGISLTDTSKRHGLSRASVVRFVREAQQRDAAASAPLEVGDTCK